MQLTNLSGTELGSVMSPEGVLHVMRDLNQCFIAGSRPLPAQVDYVPLTAVISFSLLGQSWVLPLDQVSELLELQDFTPLPGVKPWVVGVSNVRGKLLPIIDFAQFLGGRLSALQRLQRIVVLDRNDTFVGLIVDEVKGMRHFSVDTYEADNNNVPEALQVFVKGYYKANDGSRSLLLSPDAVIENPLFQDVAL